MELIPDEQIPCQTPRYELAAKALRHYDEISSQACSWHSLIPEAIKLWEQTGWREVPVPPNTICVLWNGTTLSGLCCFGGSADSSQFEKTFRATHYFPIPSAPEHPDAPDEQRP